MKDLLRPRRGRWAALAALILLLLSGGLAASPRGDAAALKMERIEDREEHPLWRGGLNGAARDRRFEAFAAAFDRREDPAGLFGIFLDEIGVKRMVDYVKGKDHACHGALHTLGAVLLERTRDLKTSMMLCGNACTYACVHGAVRGYLSKMISEEGDVFPAEGGEGTAGRLRRELLSLCREDSKVVEDFFAGNCAHAVGHGLAALSNGLSEARGKCGLFPDAERRYYCESGVFMELRPDLARLIDRGESSPAGRRETALRFCVQHSGWPSACLRFLLEPASRPEEIEAVSRQCAFLDGKARRGCFNAVGYLSRTDVASQPEEINRVCRRGDPTDRALCISGLVFVKKNHRLKGKLSAACAYLTEAPMRAVCEDQRRRFYYQTDNPVLKQMLVDVAQIPPGEAGTERQSAQVPSGD